MKIHAPFTLEQRHALDRQQSANPSVCPRLDTEEGGYHREGKWGRARGQLLVTGNGLICPECGYHVLEADLATDDA